MLIMHDLLILLSLLLLSTMVSIFIERSLSKAAGRPFTPLNVAIPGMLICLLYVRGLELETVLQGFAFVMILYHAALQDIQTRTVNDYLPIMIVLTAFIHFDAANLFDMAAGGLITASPLFLMACIRPGSIGGADIKLMAASGLLLGLDRGLAALIVGLLTSIVATCIIRKVKKQTLKDSFALVPYLGIGCYLAFLI